MTKITKERSQMQTSASKSQVPPLPLPKNEKKRLMQAEVNLELFNAVHKEMKRKGLKVREVMEWGLKGFLLATNPEAAAKLGIEGTSFK